MLYIGEVIVLITDVKFNSKPYFIDIETLSTGIYTTTNRIKTEVAQIAAEILYLVAGFGKKLTKQDVSDLLYIPYTNLQRPLELLKKKNLIRTDGKKFTFTGDYSQIITEESSFEIYTILYGNSIEWYSDREKHYDLINLIFTITNWLGLGVPTSERRRLTKCLCFDCFNCCSDKHWAQAKKDLLTLKKDKLQKRFDNCHYSDIVLTNMEFRKEKNIRLHYFNLAKKCLYNIRDTFLEFSYLSNEEKKDIIADEIDKTLKGGNNENNIFIEFAEKAVKNAFEFFQDVAGTSMKINMDKRIMYLLEYIVHQPISCDNEFDPRSPFYGKDLDTRLGMIQDTLGLDSEYYDIKKDKHKLINQEQCKGLFNCQRFGGKGVKLNEEKREEYAIYKK